MSGLLFDDISTYVKDLISKEFGCQVGLVNVQEDENHINPTSESGNQPDGLAADTETNLLDR
jgi:hypothetical protein